jgi:hypothetical protein
MFVNGILSTFQDDHVPVTAREAFKEKLSSALQTSSSNARLSSILQDFSAAWTRRHLQMSRQQAL